ncbi:MAG: DUF5652 family protein [Nanoarchaeota archaeon]
MVFESLTPSFSSLPWWVVLISIWDLVWRAFAIWKSTNRNQPIWSVAFLLFQTVGILPILYIFLFSEMKPKPKQTIKKPVKKKRKK